MPEFVRSVIAARTGQQPHRLSKANSGGQTSASLRKDQTQLKFEQDYAGILRVYEHTFIEVAPVVALAQQLRSRHCVDGQMRPSKMDNVTMATNGTRNSQLFGSGLCLYSCDSWRYVGVSVHRGSVEKRQA
jgi:hypothetical protein